MHELSVTQSLLEIALRHANQAGAQRITDLHLVIGQFSSIIDDSVQFYWDFVAQDTLAQDARLHFRRVPAEMACRECGERFSPGDREFRCPACGSHQLEVTAGDEFYLEAIEVEGPDQGDA